MAKAASPVRLQEDLMQSATTTGKRQHRSAAEQIEYWASLGRSVANVVNPENLLAVTTGLARLKVEPIEVQPVDPESVFATLEDRRKSGALVESVTHSSVRYQASTTAPGLLDQIAADGQVTVGQFSHGKFTPQ